MEDSVEYREADPEKVVAYLDSVSAQGLSVISFRRPVKPIPNAESRDWKEILTIDLIRGDKS